MPHEIHRGESVRDRWENTVLTVVTEDGVSKIRMKDYNRSPEIRDKFGLAANPPPGRRTLFLGTQLFSFSTDWLNQNPSKRRLFEEAEEEYERCPLAYFFPQSPAVIEFLNWRHDRLGRTYKVLLAGNGTGKTTAALIDVLLDIIPCDPMWPLFREHGVKYRQYKGPYTNGGVACVSYKLATLQFTIFPQVIAAWTPREFIADYVDGRKQINWSRNAYMTIADTPVYFYAVTQSQTTFESQALNICWWDEEGSESRFQAADRRLARREGRHVQSLTPLRLVNEQDSFGDAYVERIYKGEMEISCEAQFFAIDIGDVPDWVYREDEKRKAIREWIEIPSQHRDERKLAEGRARIHGAFYHRSGKVLDTFDPSVHVVQPFEVPDTWTFYRYHDHGRKEPNACLLIAVDEEDNYYAIGEYYVSGADISENALGIIRDLTGNDVRHDGDWCVEVPISRCVVRTVSDPRSLSKTLDNVQHTIQEEYARNGLVLEPGSGQPVEKLVPLLSQLLSLDDKRTHIETGKPGAPRLYIFADCVNFIRELDNWRYKVYRSYSDGRLSARERPANVNDHLITCALLLAADMPTWVEPEVVRRRFGVVESQEGEENVKDRPRCPITGY